MTFCSALFGSMESASGHRPGAHASTNAATAVPSFQSDVKFIIFLCGICLYKTREMSVFFNTAEQWTNNNVRKPPKEIVIGKRNISVIQRYTFLKVSVLHYKNKIVKITNLVVSTVASN